MRVCWGGGGCPALLTPFCDGFPFAPPESMFSVPSCVLWVLQVYLVMDFLQGGELYVHLRRKGRFRENRAKFYSAQVHVDVDAMSHDGVCCNSCIFFYGNCE